MDKVKVLYDALKRSDLSAWSLYDLQGLSGLSFDDINQIIDEYQWEFQGYDEDGQSLWAPLFMISEPWEV